MGHNPFTQPPQDFENCIYWESASPQSMQLFSHDLRLHPGIQGAAVVLLITKQNRHMSAVQ